MSKYISAISNEYTIEIDGKVFELLNRRLKKSKANVLEIVLIEGCGQMDKRYIINAMPSGPNENPDTCVWKIMGFTFYADVKILASKSRIIVNLDEKHQAPDIEIK